MYNSTIPGDTPAWATGGLLGKQGRSTLLTDLSNYWTLDEASGNRADSVGGVTLSGTNAPLGGTGKKNNGTVFNGTNQYLSNSSLPSFDSLAGITLNFWVKTADNTGYFTALGVAPILRVGQTTGAVYLQARDSDNTSLTVQTAFVIADDAWHMVTCVFDSADNKAKVYVDTSLKGATAAGSPPGTRASTDIIIGGDFAASLNEGTIDEYGIWTRTLTTTEIAELYNGGTGKFYPYV